MAKVAIMSVSFGPGIPCRISWSRKRQNHRPMFVSLPSSPAFSRCCVHLPCGVGKDAVGSWIDLAGFVSAGGHSAHTPYDGLADLIGRDCYIDVCGWHLYLKDIKVASGSQITLAQGVAQKLGSQASINPYSTRQCLKGRTKGPQLTSPAATPSCLQIQGQGFKSSSVADLLRAIPVKLGQGKVTVSLEEAMPAGCIRDLCAICEKFERDL